MYVSFWRVCTVLNSFFLLFFLFIAVAFFHHSSACKHAWIHAYAFKTSLSRPFHSISFPPPSNLILFFLFFSYIPSFLCFRALASFYRHIQRVRSAAHCFFFNFFNCFVIFFCCCFFSILDQSSVVREYGQANI